MLVLIDYGWWIFVSSMGHQFIKCNKGIKRIQPGYMRLYTRNTNIYIIMYKTPQIIVAYSRSINGYNQKIKLFTYIFIGSAL